MGGQWGRSFVTDDLEQIKVLKQLLISARTELNALLDVQSNLIIRAPITGNIVEWGDAMERGRWINTKDQIGLIKKTDLSIVKAYVSEEDLHRIEIGLTGRFFPDDAAQSSLPVKIVDIDKSSTDELNKPYLSSDYGGYFDTYTSENNTELLNTSVYAVNLETETDIIPPGQVTRGMVIINGETTSIFERIYKAVWAVLIRESGF